GLPGADSCNSTLNPQSASTTASARAHSPSPGPFGTSAGLRESIATSAFVSATASPYAGLAPAVLLGPRILSFAYQFVGLVLRHLAAAHHVLHQVPRALNSERGEPRGGIDDIFHRGGHLTAGFHADFLRLRRHL